jgi:hypothetical protein
MASMLERALLRKAIKQKMVEEAKEIIRASVVFPAHCERTTAAKSYHDKKKRERRITFNVNGFKQLVQRCQIVPREIAALEYEPSQISCVNIAIMCDEETQFPSYVEIEWISCPYPPPVHAEFI